MAAGKSFPAFLFTFPLAGEDGENFLTPSLMFDMINFLKFGAKK